MKAVVKWGATEAGERAEVVGVEEKGVTRKAGATQMAVERVKGLAGMEAEVMKVTGRRAKEVAGMAKGVDTGPAEAEGKAIGAEMGAMGEEGEAIRVETGGMEAEGEAIGEEMGEEVKGGRRGYRSHPGPLSGRCWGTPLQLPSGAAQLPLLLECTVAGGVNLRSG